MSCGQIKPQNVRKQLKNKNVSEQIRVVRGYAIISKGDTPKKTGKDTYTLPSQSGNGFYTVTKNGVWRCTCPDYQERKQECKHIHAIKFYLALKKQMEDDSKELVTSEKPNCIFCQSSDVIRRGYHNNKNTIKQRFRCNDCNKSFIAEKDFERMKGDAKITTVILDLYFKGISLRQIKDHLKQFYDLSLDASNILRRIRKFSGIIDNYVKTLKPELSEIWHTDEMKIQAGGKWKWLWNVMDSESRFLVTRMVTDRRRIRDSNRLFNEAKEVADKQPMILVTDGCHSYRRSIEKVLPETNHVRLTSIRDKRTNNNNIERLNGTIRDRIKVMRGMQNQKSANEMTSAYANYYNFIKPHSAIGTTPALKAGINTIRLEGNRWEQLLRKSLEYSPIRNSEEK